MNRWKIFPAALSIAWILIGLSGCEDKPLTIMYDRPPEYLIPQSVTRIAVAEFGGKTLSDKKFGDIAADELASQLDVLNQKYRRYQLVDRKRLRAILDEQDLQLAISDTASANQAGNIANVHAMIYGSVTVSSRDEQESRMGFDIRTRRPTRVYYTRRYCMASINFTMDDVRTSKTLAALTLTSRYDSQKDQGAKKSQIVKAIGVSGGDELVPADQILSQLISQCVQQFVAKISPHSMVVTEKMEKGKSKIVQTGNKLARTGDYTEALESYMRAIKNSPEDDGAMFNIGLVYEARGQFDKAQEYYSKAFAIKDKEKYILARKRVRSVGAK